MVELQGVPARPSALTPNQWILGLERTVEEPVLHVRRYIIASESPRPSGNVNLDPFEIAWRRFNGDEGDNNIDGLLARPSAVIDGQGGTRELWVFALDANKLDTSVAGLQGKSDKDLAVANQSIESEPKPPAAPMSDLISCPSHGHDLSCLKRTERCDLLSCPPPELGRIWNLFACSLVERLAWASGQRLSLRSSNVIDLPTLPSPSLRLLTPNTLLLSLRSAANPELSAPLYELRPLSLPAIRLDTAVLSPARQARLAASFDSALGPSWRKGLCDANSRAQLHNRPYAEYTVFWVPISPGETVSQKSIGKSTPRQLIEKYQRGHGIATIWPTHLAKTPEQPPTTSCRPTALPLAESAVDLMNVASGLFDFMASYREPQPIDITDDPDEDVREDEDQTMDGDSVAGLEPIQEASPKSDLDDLFSAPNSPGPPELLDEDSPPQVFEADLPGSEVAKPEDRPRSVAPTSRTTDERVETKQEDLTLITEDDFAFFDSPSQPGEGGDEGMEIDQPLRHSDDEVNEVLDQNETVNPPVPQPTDEPTATASEPEPAQKSDVMPQIRPLSPVLITPPTAVRKSSKNPYTSGEMIPTSFEPLDLTLSQSPFTYSLPSPAPTPEGLRPDLLERLKPSAQIDYASAWELDDTPSETEDEEYTGPPTPESFVDTDDESAKPSPLPIIGTAQRMSTSDEECIEYHGIPCVGTEWLRLRYDVKAASEFGRPWNANWPKLAEIDSPARSTSKVLAGLDIERLVRLMTGNRALRQSISTDAFKQFLPESLGIASATLSDWDPNLKFRHLSPPFINAGYAGYAGNIMRLSISALQYWTVLGLQPAGGKKDIEAICICEKGERARMAAKQFLIDIGRVYTDHRLGHHRPFSGALDGLTDGVGQMSFSKIGDTIRKLGNITSTLVVYVLSSTARPLGQILDTPLPENRVIQMISPSSLAPSALPALATEIYDCIPLPLQPINVRGEQLDLDSGSKHVRSSAYTLARDTTPRPDFQLSWPVRSYDVLNRDRTIYIAYSSDEEMELTICVAMDDLGESWEVGWWIDHHDEEQGSIYQMQVGKVWDWAKKVARDWAVEHQLVICRFGLMTVEEMDAWRHLLNTRNTPTTLIMLPTPTTTATTKSSATSTIPRPRPTANIPPASLSDPNARLIDSSLLGCSATFSVRVPVDLPHSSSPSSPSTNTNTNNDANQSTTIYPLRTFILEMGDESNAYHVLYQQRELEDLTTEKVTLDLYRLWALSKRRWGEDVGLPGHLQVLDWGMRAAAWVAGGGA